jgi:hypothetical protein
MMKKRKTFCKIATWSISETYLLKHTSLLMVQREKKFYKSLTWSSQDGRLRAADRPKQIYLNHLVGEGKVIGQLMSPWPNGYELSFALFGADTVSVAEKSARHSNISGKTIFDAGGILANANQ